MNREKFFPPKHAEGKFHCPHCSVLSKQRWAHIRADRMHKGSSIQTAAHFSEVLKQNWTIAKCDYCNDYSIWLDSQIIHPKQIPVVPPNEDLNEDIRKDYLEAAQILNDSPRAAAALLRLALQKLCVQLGEQGKDINTDIGNLVEKGLNIEIQQSLDALRITGNHAVHPGEIDMQENPETARKLFDLMNFIAEKMITEPNKIKEFYESLPDRDKASVEKRDK